MEIPVYTVSSKSKEAFEIISNFSPDIIFVVAYGQILPKRILNIAKLYPLNIHFSLLPHYRGATPVNTSLLNGDSETGTTLMIMDEKLDSGDILYQKPCPLTDEDNASTLFEKLTNLSIKILEENWQEITKGCKKRIKQSENVTYTKLINKSDLKLDFSENAQGIFNKIRAFTMEPGVKTIFRGNTLFIEKASLDKNLSGKSGTIGEVGKNFFTIFCNNGALLIHQVKPAGKKSMSTKEFINGYKPQTGEVFK